MINETLPKKFSQLQKISHYEICVKHDKPLYKICITCKNDLCSQCEKEHVNHYIIKQEEIMPDSEEIKKLQFGIENFINDSNQLIDNIKTWQNEINEKILFFENENKNNKILNSFDFINNYNSNKLSINNIIKFRKIYSCIIGLENKNNKILSFLNEDNLYNKQNNNLEYNKNNLNVEYNNYMAIKYLLKDINKYQDNFIKKSKKIVEYLFNFLNNNYNKNLNKTSEKPGLKDNQLNNQNTPNKSYIIKKIDNNINKLKSRHIHKDKNNRSEDNKLYKSWDNFSAFKRSKNSASDKGNESTYSLSNLGNGIINNTIYSKKNYLSKNKVKGKSVNLKNDDTFKSYSLSNINPRKLFSNSTYLNNIKNSNVNDKSNNIKSMVDLQINNNIKKKTYVHKKFILKKDQEHNVNKKIQEKLGNNYIIQTEYSTDNKSYNNHNNIYINTDFKINNSKSPINYNYNRTENRNKNNNIFLNTDSKLNLSKSPINNNYNKSENINNNIIDIPISFIKNKKNNNIKSTLFISPFQMENKLDSKTYNNDYSQVITNQIFVNPNNNFINKNFDINIIKPLKYEFIRINNDKKLYIGIDLGNIETKIGIIKNYNEIQLINFSENNYSLPTMISFNNKNNDILIGPKIEELLINNPSQTIFNIIKIFGHEYDDIINDNQTHLLWPFKLYKDNSNKPYIKIKMKKDEKHYYFEEILILFLKKLFDLIFQKITIENIGKNEKRREIQLNISLIVSIPNYFTFFQRKLLEKIFILEIFPKNSSFYGGYQIILDKIGIENRTSMAGLCLKNNPKIKNNNILIINLDTCSADVSVISIYNNINKVIAVDSIELIDENFTDNFINLCLKILKKNNVNIPKEFLYSDSLLSKIRKISSNIIKNLTLKEETIFIIDNLNNGNGNCIIKVSRIDYDKICFELCKKIIILIKNILIKSKLNENDINDIILIGDAINMNKLNQMIKELFINNKTIYEKLSNNQKTKIDLNDENIDYFTVAGSAIGAYSLDNPNSSYNFKNVCPINLGIELYDGNMNTIIRKNSDLPLIIKKNIKIKNHYNNVIIINIYEGENIVAKNNKLISQFIFNKTEFKFVENKKREYIELPVEFEIDNFLNIIFYINDFKSYEHLFKCEINIEKVQK